MSTTDPNEKNERSRHFASGYKLGNLLKNEEAIDNTIRLFLERLDGYAKTGKALDLDKYISMLAFDVIGEILFSKQFGFLKQDRDWKFRAFFTMAPYGWPVQVKNRVSH